MDNIIEQIQQNSDNLGLDLQTLQQISVLSLTSYQLADSIDKYIENIEKERSNVNLNLQDFNSKIKEITEKTNLVINKLNKDSLKEELNELNDIYKNKKDLKDIKSLIKKAKKLHKKVLDNIEKKGNSNMSNKDENFSLAIGSIMSSIYLINAVTMLGGRLFSLIKLGKINVEQLKEHLIQIKETTDKFFKVKEDSDAIESVKNKYRGLWEEFVKNEYDPKIDTLDIKELKDLFKRTRNLTNKIAKEMDKINSKITKNKTKVISFSEYDLDLFDTYLDAHFSDNLDEIIILAKALYDMRNFRMKKKYNIKDYKNAVSKVKQSFDKFFTTESSPEIQKIKAEYYPSYTNFINAYYIKAMDDKNALFNIHSGFDKLGSNLLKDLKKLDKDNQINTYLEMFSNNDQEEIYREKINDVKNKIQTFITISDNLFFHSKIDDNKIKPFIDKHKVTYEKLKNKSNGILNTNDEKTLKAYVTELQKFVDAMQKDAAKLETSIAFSEMLKRRNFITNFSLVEERDRLLNTFRLISKEMPKENMFKKNDDLMNKFISVQKTFLGERVDAGKPELIRSKIRLMNELQLIEFNQALREVLREIRDYNNKKEIENVAKQNEMQNSRFGKQKDSGLEDSSKLKRFLIDAKKVLFGPNTAVLAGVGTTLKLVSDLKKLKSRNFSFNGYNFSIIKEIECTYPQKFEESKVFSLINELKENIDGETNFSHLYIFEDGNFVTY